MESLGALFMLSNLLKPITHPIELLYGFSPVQVRFAGTSFKYRSYSAVCPTVFILTCIEYVRDIIIELTGTVSCIKTPRNRSNTITYDRSEWVV